MAKINFPDPTSTNPWYNPANGITYVHADNTWSAVTSTNASDFYVNVDGDQMTGDLTVPSLNGGPLGGFRNLIINGDFLIWQRGGGEKAVQNTGEFFSDRFNVRGTDGSGGTPTVRKFVDGSITKHRFIAQGLTGPTYIKQIIEANNAQNVVGKKIVFSCYANYIPVFHLQYFDNTDTSVDLGAVVGQLVPGETNRYYAEYNIPDAVIGTTQNGRGIEALIYPTNDGDTSNNISDGNYDTWYVQFEEGSAATPFENRFNTIEKSLCERYYQRIVIRGIAAVVGADGGVPGVMVVPVPKPMRIANPNVEATQLRFARKNHFGGDAGNDAAANIQQIQYANFSNAGVLFDAVSGDSNDVRLCIGAITPSGNSDILVLESEL